MPGLDHNAFYQRTLLRQVPRGATDVLEIGCGAGAFAARLAEHHGPGGHVDAWDVSLTVLHHLPLADALERRYVLTWTKPSSERPGLTGDG